MAQRVIIQVGSDGGDHSRENSVNITFSQDHPGQLHESQIQNSGFKPDAPTILESTLPGNFEKEGQKERDPGKSDPTGQSRSGWRDSNLIKVDDSYSFSYTLSKHTPELAPKATHQSQVKDAPYSKNKDLKRIISKTSNTKYKPKFLKSSNFIKSMKKSSHRDKIDFVQSPTTRNPRTDKKTPKNKQAAKGFAKLVYSKTGVKTHSRCKRRSILKTSPKPKTDRQRPARTGSPGTHDGVLARSHDLFVQKSVNRLLNLEDLQQVITKSKKQIRKSKRKKTVRY